MIMETFEDIIFYIALTLSLAWNIYQLWERQQGTITNQTVINGALADLNKRLQAIENLAEVHNDMKPQGAGSVPAEAVPE